MMTFEILESYILNIGAFEDIASAIVQY